MLAAKLSSRLKSDAPQEIADLLSLHIRNGGFPEGARLPSEHGLAEHFDVSRPVVREAISRVKADGLVESRQGSGLYVTGLLERQSFKVHAELSKDPSSVIKLFELRMPIEIMAARLAANRRLDYDVAQMEMFHVQMEQSQDVDPEKYDLQFHLAIANATRNQYFTELMAYLGGVIYTGIRFARSSSGPKVHRKAILEHGRILTAIKDRQPEAAEKAMRAHINGALRRMNAGK